MRIVTLQVENFRSFKQSGVLKPGLINVFIGPNNAGKSTLLRAVHQIQEGVSDRRPDIRNGEKAFKVLMTFEQGQSAASWWDGTPPSDSGELEIRSENDRLQIRTNNGSRYVAPLPAREPQHAIVPILAKRKAAQYIEDVSENSALSVTSDLSTLAAKLSRLSSVGFPSGLRYQQTCKAVLGFIVTSNPASRGQRAGIYLPDGTTLPIDQMGEGVPHIVGMLADLSLATEKIFLIEEPENDLHPGALKALLDLIETSAHENNNQFFISTHSNIVLRTLGSSDDSRVFYVSSEPDVLPTRSSVREVKRTPEARLAVLRELGYGLSDFELWDGWVILEESSAERIIRDYLVKWFAPKLSRVRLLSANGSSKVEPMFEDFRRLALFTHLEETYRDAAWVRVDGDTGGEQIVARLRSQFPSWSPDRFGTFSEPNSRTTTPRSSPARLPP